MGVPIRRIIVFGAVSWGPPISGNYPSQISRELFRGALLVETPTGPGSSNSLALLGPHSGRGEPEICPQGRDFSKDFISVAIDVGIISMAPLL